jgi:endothelin-converting enzyme
LQEVVIIQASPYGITLPSPEYYEDKDTIQKYESTMSEVFASLLPSSGPRKKADQLARSVVDLEKKIASVTPPPEDQQDVTVRFALTNLRAIC